MTLENIHTENSTSKEIILPEIKKRDNVTTKKITQKNNNASEQDSLTADRLLQGIESQEQYEPTKVYEIKNINEVGFGKASAVTNHQSFTINGPLFGADNMPVGGYIDNKITKKGFIEPSLGGGNFAVDNGVMGLGVDGKLHLIPYTQLSQSTQSFTWAFQNGPMLVLNGLNIRGTSTSKFNRSGIGFREDGKAIAIYSDTPITFKEFADMFVQQGCTNAIYLDGGPTAGYEDETGKHGYLQPNATKIQLFHQK